MKENAPSVNERFKDKISMMKGTGGTLPKRRRPAKEKAEPAGNEARIGLGFGEAL
jgi:hypothetical protein